MTPRIIRDRVRIVTASVRQPGARKLLRYKQLRLRTSDSLHFNGVNTVGCNLAQSTKTHAPSHTELSGSDRSRQQTLHDRFCERIADHMAELAHAHVELHPRYFIASEALETHQFSDRHVLRGLQFEKRERPATRFRKAWRAIEADV